MPPAGVGPRRAPVASLPGWPEFDFASIWPAWRRSARAIAAQTSPLRPAWSSGAALERLLHAVAELPDHIPNDDIRRLLEHCCEACLVAGPGFLTGYYEPVVDGSLSRTPPFTAPILPRPADLVTLGGKGSAAAIPEGFAAARRRDDGVLEPYDDRATLEARALEPDAKPVVWLRDWTEVFLIHVQGSARVRLPDGSMRRLVYAGRNGHPYTSIGRHIVEAGEIPLAEMSLARLKHWIRTHGQGAGEPGRVLMQRNRSYIFFDLKADNDDPGPTGGAGVPLTPGVSIAVDRSQWSYGLPFWIAAEAALPGFGSAPLARLFIAQDTGSAIVGPARVDLFLGSGEAAGEAAGSIRHSARVAVLLPKL